MRMTRKGAGAVALGLGVALTAGACAGGAGAAEEVPAAPVAPGVEAPAVDAGPVSVIGDAQRVGAMADWGLGGSFVASEPITLELMYRVHDGYPVQDDWLIWTHLAETRNVNFDRTDVLIADWGERRNLLIGAGDFPTLVPNVWPGSQGGWEAGGALLPISDFLDYLPNFTHFLAEWDLERQFEQHRNEDGNIYILPILREMPGIEHSFMINVDLFEAAGAPTEFATFEELGAALRLVQENTDVDYAFSERWNVQEAGPLGAAMNFVGPNFDTQGGWAISGPLGTTRWNAELGEFVAAPMVDGYREMVGFFAGLMADGAMDPDITQEDDVANQKFIEGRSAMVTTNFSQMEAVRADAREQGVELNAKMIAVPAGTHNAISASGGGFGPGFVINANIQDSPYFLATLQFLDWILFTEEGREFTVWGVDGITFTTDADGNRWYYGDVAGFGDSGLNPNFADLGGRENMRMIDAYFGFQDGVWIGTHNAGSEAMAGSLMAPELRNWWVNELANKDLQQSAAPAPLTEEETELAGIIGAEINAWVWQQTAFFISGQRSMDDWPAFMAELEAMGMNQLVDMRNEAMRRAQD